MSKQQIMEGLASSIQQELIHFPEGQLVNELESFGYEYTAHGVRYEAREGLHDDGVCALALANHKLRSFTPLELSQGSTRQSVETANRYSPSSNRRNILSRF